MSEKLYISTLKRAGKFEDFKLNELSFEGVFNKNGTLSTFDINLSFNEGSIIERPLINNLKEYYVIEEVNFDKGIKNHKPASWKLKVVKQGKNRNSNEQPLFSPQNNQPDTINIYNFGDVRGGQMVGTTGSTQNVNYSEKDNNISEHLEILLNKVQESQLDYIDKDDVEEIINRLNKFSKVEDKSTIITRAKDRLKSLNSLLSAGISTAKLAPEVFDIYSKIENYFTSL